MKKTGLPPQPVFETEWNIPEIARQNQNNFLKSILNCVVSGVVVADENGQLVFFNAPARQILGMGPQSLSPADWSRAYGCFLPDRKTLFPSEALPLARALRGEIVHDVEVYICNARQPDGVWLKINAAPLYDEQGNLKGGVAVFRDITAFKQSEADLEQTEQRFEAILDNTPAIVYVKDLEGKYLFVNRAFEELFHSSRIGILSKTDYHFCPKEQADAFRANDQRVLKEKIPIQFEEILVRDGITRTYVSVKFPLSDSLGKAYAVCGISTDITHRKQTEESLRQTEHFLDSIIENLPDMIFVKDAKNLQFVRLNKAAEELLGHSRKSLIGKSDYDFFPKEEAEFFTSKDRETLESGKLLDIPEEMIDTRYKGRRILRTKKIPITDDEGKPAYLLGISEDITENKLVKEALMRKTIELAGSVAERQQLELFAYVASHDLQEPLQKIIAFSDMLATHSKNVLDEKGMEFLKRTQNAAFRMSRLVEDLVRFSRALTRSISKTYFPLEEILEEVKIDLELPLQEAAAEIQTDSLPAVYADKVQIRQLIFNLLSNALKFRKKDEKLIIQISSKVFEEDRKVEITVSDNGIGFDPQYRDHIFKPFERLHSKHDYDGSGLGLSICHRVALAHGGDIRAESEPGKGSRFILILPMKESAQADSNPLLPGIFK